MNHDSFHGPVSPDAAARKPPANPHAQASADPPGDPASPVHRGVPQEPVVSEAWLERVLDIAADAIVVCDDKSHILVFNKACQNLFGYTLDEMLGMDICELMPAAYSASHELYVNSYLRTGEKRIIGIGREVQAKNRAGEIFPVELSVGEAITCHGRHFIGILRDLRPRKAFEQRLGQLQGQILHMTRLNAVDEMGAVMAHELNQPLTALMLYLQAMSRTMGGAGDAAPNPQIGLMQSVLDKAIKEAQRAASIIQRMRSMVEKKRGNFQPCDLRSVVSDAIEHATFVAQGATVPILAGLPADPVTVDIDPIQVQQIIGNLLRNAIEVAQAMPERWIRVTLTCQGMGEGNGAGYACVAVEDSGHGIAPDVAATLFRSFNTTKPGGMGLGLAISRSLAQNHGGDLTADPGGLIATDEAGDETWRGAIFRLTLPLRPSDRGSDESAPLPRQPPVTS